MYGPSWDMQHCDYMISSINQHQYCESVYVGIYFIINHKDYIENSKIYYQFLIPPIIISIQVTKGDQC